MKSLVILEKATFIKILNAAIQYGGDCGGAYFNSRGKDELIKELERAGYVIEFDKWDFVKDIRLKG